MRVITILSTFMLPLIVQAHPGHGASNGHDAPHFLLSGGHAAPALVVLLAASLYLMLRTSKSRSAKL